MIRRRHVFDGTGTSERHGAELHAAGFASIAPRNDCGFYGQWANPATRTIVAFTEGDLTRTECDTDEEFASELRRIAEWYGNDEWIGIDTTREDLRGAFTRIGVNGTDALQVSALRVLGCCPGARATEAAWAWPPPTRRVQTTPTRPQGSRVGHPRTRRDELGPR